MIKSIIATEDSLLSKVLFFREIELQQVTLLMGGNGVGKSTLLNEILNQRCDIVTPEPTRMYSYVNSKQNFKEMDRNDQLSYQDMFDPNLISRKFSAGELSEGQSIIYSLQEIFQLCKYLSEEPTENFIVLLDEIDSGLSVDNVEYLAKKIKRIAKSNPNIQFLIAFNNYEFCREFKTVFNMYTGKWTTISSYDDYRNTIKSNRKELLKKRKNNQFTGRSNF